MGAWFQVQVEMVTHPKMSDLRRNLGCSQLEAAGIVLAMFTWGVEHVDKEGFFIRETEEELGRYIQYVNAGTTLTTDAVIENLKSAGWLDVTENGPCIHDWDIWQAALFRAKELREKDMLRKRESRRLKAVAQKAEETEMYGNFLEAEPDADHTKEEETNPPEPPKEPEEPVKPKRRVTNYGPEFEAFWDAYPRPVDKGNAYKKYQARRNDGWSDEELLTAAKNYAARCRRLHTEQEYIKHPKTFLSDAMPFRDYLPKKEVQSSENTVPDGSNPFAEYGKEGR